MVEVDGQGRPSAVGHVTRQHLCRAGHGRVHAGPREMQLRIMGLAMVGYRPAPWASRASLRLLPGPGGPAGGVQALEARVSCLNGAVHNEAAMGDMTSVAAQFWTPLSPHTPS